MQESTSSVAGGSELNVAQAARELGIGYSTARLWIKQGRLPAERVGEQVYRIKPADVARLRAAAADSDPERDQLVTVINQRMSLLSTRQLRELTTAMGVSAV